MLQNQRPIVAGSCSLYEYLLQTEGKAPEWAFNDIDVWLPNRYNRECHRKAPRAVAGYYCAMQANALTPAGPAPRPSS